jgi:hypothetical protein
MATGVVFMPGPLAIAKFLLRSTAVEYLPESKEWIVKSFSFDFTDGTEFFFGGEFMEFERHAEGI